MTANCASRHSRLLLCGAVALLAAACTTPAVDFGLPIHNESARSNHPLTVEKGVLSLSLAGTGGIARLSTAELGRIDEFVKDYTGQVPGPLTITIPGPAAEQPRALSRAKQIADHLKARGVEPAQVRMLVDTENQAADDPIVVSYETVVLNLPECGDWSKEPSHDPSNSAHPNFGCATQRTVGMMLANPADLVRPRATSLIDSTRSNTIIQLYRAGLPTGAERATVEEADLTEVGE